MSYLDQHNELRSRFSSAWGSTTPVDWPNVEFDVPTSGSWVRFRILDGASRQTTIGGSTNNHRHLGVLVISVFSELGKGDATSLSLVDTVAGIFRNWKGTNITCRQPAIRNIGPDGYGWYQTNVEISFIRDQLI